MTVVSMVARLRRVFYFTHVFLFKNTAPFFFPLPLLTGEATPMCVARVNFRENWRWGMSNTDLWCTFVLDSDTLQASFMSVCLLFFQEEVLFIARVGTWAHKG